MWMVRSSGGDYVSDFKDSGIVAVGWKDAGSLKGLNRDQIIERVRETWPSDRPKKALMSGSQLDKIVNVMEVGERVLTYDPSKRIYSIGCITGEYEFDDKAEDGLANRRG